MSKTRALSTPRTILASTKCIASLLAKNMESATGESFVIEQVLPRPRRKQHKRRWAPTESKNHDLFPANVAFAIRAKRMKDRPNPEFLGHNWSYAVILHDLRVSVSVYNPQRRDVQLLARVLQEMAIEMEHMFIVNVVTADGYTTTHDTGKIKIYPKPPRRHI